MSYIYVPGAIFRNNNGHPGIFRGAKVENGATVSSQVEVEYPRALSLFKIKLRRLCGPFKVLCATFAR